MTWIDIAAVVILVVFVAVGARLGSVWTGACLLGGFFGSFLADVYSLPLAEFLGGFPGAGMLSAISLFLCGLIVVLVPGWILSKMSSILFLGIVDSAFGFLTGALTGLVALSLILLLIVPLTPKVEKSKTWKKSAVVKPWHDSLERFFNSPSFRPESLRKKLSMKNINKLSSASKKEYKKMKKKAERAVDEIKR